MPVIGYCRNLHSNLCPCFVCSKKFSLDNGVEDLLTHICFTHHIIVGNIERIADFKSYMEYYAKRLRESPLESFAKEYVVEPTEGDYEPRERKYHFLGELSPEDENLRRTLHAKRLKATKKQQNIDLGPNYFVRHCFYCHRTSEMTNAQFVNHLRSHGFQLGHPEKLVYIDKFIEAIEDTFRNLHCLYCEMEFESCGALIHHMEKKGHLKIHPNNSFYDQFYMINYVEFGKTWLDFVKEKNRTCPEDNIISINDDTDWSSWGTEPENIMCLFCKHVCRSWEGTLLHLQVSHNFDFKRRLLPLKFYDQVKIVNYIRRRIMNKLCINCDFQSENENDIVSHMEKTNHLEIPNSDLWDHDEYFFCTLENDMFLCHLEDNAEDGDNKRKDTLDNEETVTVDEHKEYMVDIESESGHSSLSQDSVTEDKDIMYLKDQLEKSSLSVNANDMKTSGDDSVLSVSGVDIGLKEVEVHSAAHMGGGDSIQETTVAEGQTVITKKMNEFGDA